MSNTRKIRELNGGRLTRPRSAWMGKARGYRRSPTGMMMQESAKAFARLWRAGARGNR